MKKQYYILMVMAALPLMFLISNPSLSLGVSPANVAQEGDVMMKIKGVPYDEARTVILDAQWVPLENTNPDELVYVSRDMYDKGYVEVDVCSPIGATPCKFFFKNADEEYLEVITESEASLVTSVRVLNAQEFSDSRPKFDD